mmetsp:Transcript_58368/g.136624  ORF Transcript_58368/g.136624 Transcript_58368/m.136624 type:complete len:264 (+) Transcript_58368:161-952(+)
MMPSLPGLALATSTRLLPLLLLLRMAPSTPKSSAICAAADFEEPGLDLASSRCPPLLSLSESVMALDLDSLATAAASPRLPPISSKWPKLSLLLSLEESMGSDSSAAGAPRPASGAGAGAAGRDGADAGCGCAADPADPSSSLPDLLEFSSEKGLESSTVMSRPPWCGIGDREGDRFMSELGASLSGMVSAVLPTSANMDLDTSGSGCVGAVLASVTSMAFIAAQSGVCTMGPKLGLSETATAPTFWASSPFGTPGPGPERSV